MHIIPHLNCKTSVFLPLVCNWISCQLQKGAGWVLSVWKMKKSPSVKGGIIWQSLQWAVRGFLVPKWSRFWSAWEKNWLWFISFGSQNASHNLGATQDIQKTTVPAPRNSQYPHYHNEDGPVPAWKTLCFYLGLQQPCQPGHKATARAGAWCDHGLVALKPSHPVLFCRSPL